MKKISLMILLLIFTLVLTFSAGALGDDVDFGGGDTGGGGWDSGGWDDSGGGWDSGGDEGWIGSDGGNWGGGGSGFGGGGYSLLDNSGSSPVIPIGGGMIFIIIIAAIGFYMYIQRQGNAKGPARGGGARRIDLASLQALQQSDPSFSSADIEAKVKNWVMQFEMAWANGDMTPCRPFISDGLYNTYQMQLNMMKQNGELSRTEDLAVMACSVERWTKDTGKEYLDVWLQEKKRTYKVDINNPQKIIKGDKQTTYTLEYRWQLMRSAGEATKTDAGVRVMECPNCGAQTSVNQSGKCEYCGSTLVSESFDWTLNKVDKLSQTSHR